MPVAIPAQRRPVWIHTPAWDLGWLTGTALIVPVVLMFVWAGLSSSWINLGVTCLVGGPHLFATYTATYMDPHFRRSHLWMLVSAAVLVPAFVVYWTVHDFQVLLSVFIFVASVHVLHQNAYLTDIYRRRSGSAETPWSRLVDYGLLMISMYPIASYKLVRGTFKLGEIQILIPSFVRTRTTYWGVSAVFSTFVCLWAIKTVRELRRGNCNAPKTILIGATAVIAFLVPAAAGGERLELAFQSVNAWHSLQYLAIVWYIQKVRRDRGLIESAFVRGMSGEGRAAWRFYGFCLLVTLGLLGVLLALYHTDALGALGLKRLTFQQYYYMGILSCLLIHYVLDGYLFMVSNLKRANVEALPYAAPALV